MDDPKTFLAHQILTEEKVVNYRTLSQKAKVHVNIAKQMLFDFHKTQNARKPNSVHATYLVAGTRVPEPLVPRQDDGDVDMNSSLPEVDSIPEQLPVLTVSLVREDLLNELLSRFEHVSSAHIYSLGPWALKKLQLYADTSPRAQVAATSNGQKSAEVGLGFGGVSNAHVRRREVRRVLPQALEAAKVVKHGIPSLEAKPATTSQVKGGASDVKSSANDAAAVPAQGKKPVPALSRGGSGGIMQAFAKGATKPKKKQESQPTTPTGADNGSNLALSDDGEDEDDSELIPKPTAAAAGRKSRKEREDELRRMMEDDEDDEEAEEKADTPMEDVGESPEDVPEPQPDLEKQEPAEVVATSSGDGRRRGKRRIMRKKQVMDEQGYLVTMQEAGWESFSEEEATAHASQSTTAASAPASQATKAKKVGPKANQGNIMSFFSKK